MREREPERRWERTRRRCGCRRRSGELLGVIRVKTLVVECRWNVESCSFDSSLSLRQNTTFVFNNSWEALRLAKTAGQHSRLASSSSRPLKCYTREHLSLINSSLNLSKLLQGNSPPPASHRTPNLTSHPRAPRPLAHERRLAKREDGGRGGSGCGTGRRTGRPRRGSSPTVHEFVSCSTDASTKRERGGKEGSQKNGPCGRRRCFEPGLLLELPQSPRQQG